MKVKILRSASRDLIDGYRFYEGQAPGVGVHFVNVLFSEIDALALNGGIHPVYYGNYHRMLSKRFPYAVFYRIDGEYAVVCAVIDTRRDPAWIHERLD
ncbi:MAG: type II toxin-antitoxin system RelE/ParE family toxin [Gammaproteobacteria bacterium]|nr:type II toxin-antitoxin system RelE/ParE family toxin [Gammaproteobacteria bacterium]